MKNKVSIILMIILCAFVSTRAQVATGGNYSLDQSVIAGGGGQNAAGGSFSIDGTIGQAVAGTNSTNSPFAAAGGFWTAPTLAPTAASVTIGGKVLTRDGRGLRNAFVILTDMRGETRQVLTGAFGYWRFTDVQAGETYILEVSSKRCTFATQVISVSEENLDIDFTAADQKVGRRNHRAENQSACLKNPPLRETIPPTIAVVSKMPTNDKSDSLTYHPMNPVPS